jgi:hypothetical protein
MLANRSEQYIRTSFVDEAEIEGVVQQFAEQLFGSSIVYLSQARITTLGGKGSIPDAVVIDFESNEWYLVEAERAVHGTWEHIAPQVSRQLTAVSSAKTRDALVQLALAQVHQSVELQDRFHEIGVEQLHVHGHVEAILAKAPTIAIPIDAIPKDLTDWARTLKNDVKIWLVEKFVSTSDQTRVLYSLPDENLPTIVTAATSANSVSAVRATGSRPFQELIGAMPELLGQPVFMEYGPRGSERQKFHGTIRQDGIEVEGQTYSPSYAAVRCMQKAGSTRKTANGWIRWKTQHGEVLNELYERVQAAT